MTHRHGPASVLALVLWTATAAAGAVPVPEAPVPLVVVGPDTLTTRDLSLQLNVMLRSLEGQDAVDKPDPADVLKRMVQDRLIVQEGYRIGVDERFAVRNQVEAVVREKCMTALLDSVASSAGDSLEARRAAVEGFISGLEDLYEVRVDSTLLASLDYGSEDPEVLQDLRRSEDVLVTMNDRQLKVRGLSQTIGWEEFHGLSGQPNAGETRDRIMRKWLSEVLVMRAAQERGYHRRPEIVAIGREVERALVHEEMFRGLVDLDYEPPEKELEEFYAANLAEFTPAPRIKLDSVMLNGEEAARKFCDRLRQGAKLSWLAKQTEEVVPGPPPFPPEWHEPQKLGVDPADAVLGFVPEPYEVMGGGWVAAVISGVEDPEPTPLESCRRQVVARLRAQRIQDSILEVDQKLEKETRVEILPGAEQTVSKHLDAAFATLAKD